MRGVGVVLLVVGICAAGSAAAREGYRTGPSAREPLQIVRDWIAVGREPGDHADLVVRDRYRSRRGQTHVYLRQRIAGREVFRADLAATVLSDGRLVVIGDGFVRGLARRARAERVALSAAQAEARAEAAFGEPLDPLDASLPPELVWFPSASGTLRAGWSLALRTRDDRHWWSVVVDAEDGTLLFQNDWVASDSYRVLVPPLVSPDEGGRTLAADPADPLVSPLGWHDSNGVPGADFGDTRGNNVLAQEDSDGNNFGGARPAGGPTLTFDFPGDLSKAPETYQAASIANLFYLNSRLHDVFARYGFDEASGNFQNVNYAAGPGAGDPVLADTHDGFDVNNATFATPPDGLPPRMDMYLWIDARLVVTAPPAISGTYPAARAMFGAALTPSGLGAEVVRALDPANGAGPATTDACSPLSNAAAVSGRIALIDRGTCFFTEKLANAQAAGAIGVVIANNVATPPELVTMSGIAPGVSIPALFVTQATGTQIAAALASGVTATLAGRARDGSFDVGVVVHEYAHGVTNRLTGGPSNVNCLDSTQSRGMGEGWSDFFALAFTAKPGDARALPRPIAAYLLGHPPSGPGLRTFPYSPDPSVNPRSYADIALSAQVHFVGESWASALWDLWWNLVEPYGFDPNLSAGAGGSGAALALVIDALKLQPCDPTFLDARDAILAADLAGNQSRNRCRIWTAFAKRGMGVAADDGGSAASQAVTEAFDVPPECALCGDVDDDEAVDLRDAVVLDRALAGLPPALVAPEKCNATGPANVDDANTDGLLDDCDAADSAALREHLVDLVPAPAGCAPKLGIFR